MLPFPLTRIKKAQDRVLRISQVRVMVWNWFVRVLRTAYKQWAEYNHPGRNWQYLDSVQFTPKTIKYPNKIGLVERAQPSLPSNHPARLAPDMKARPKLTHERDLLLNQQHHCFFRRSMP